MLIAAAFTERGHARLLALDCPPDAVGVVQPGRLVTETELPPGAYAGRIIRDNLTEESVTVTLLELLPEGMHRGAFIEVTHVHP